MTAIGGARDTLLQATAERFSTTADGKAILLVGSTPVFRVNSAGAGAPGAIAITAKPVNVVGDIVFSVSAGTQLAVNGNVATVDFANMTTDTALVQARIREFGVDYVANYMISKVFDGVRGDTGLAGLNTGQAFAYKRAAAAPTDSPGDVIFTFATGSITTPAGNDLANGWSKNIPAGTAPLYVCAAAASSRNATDNIAANEWAGSVQLVKDGANGVDGLNVAPLRIYQRGATNIAPALPSAACTFTFATGVLTGLNSGWSTQVPTAGGAYLFTSGATAASRGATDDIDPGEWAAAARLAADGVTTYTWVKYGNTAAGGGFSDSPVGMSYIGLAYNKATLVESDNPADYAWSLIKGGDGAKGETGADGKTTYTWIKYADNADGTGLYDAPRDSTLYLGLAVNKLSAAASTNKADYTWSKFRGGQGVAGPSGQRGTVTVTAPGYSTWSDASAVYELGHAGYGAPINRDMVTLYDATHAVTKFYVDDAWLEAGMVLNGNLLVPGTVAAKALAVDNLAAITAILGNVKAGDLYGTTLHGGVGYPTNAYAWPGPGNTGMGFHLSSAGLLLGNYSLGKYIEMRSDGDVDMPGLKIVDGQASYSGKLSAVTGSFGAVTIAPGGSISSGQTGFNTGKGFWLGIDAGIPKFSLGEGGGAGIRWDGNDLYVVNPKIASFDLAITAGASGSYFTLGRNAVDRFAGAYTATATNGSGSFTYLWRLEGNTFAWVSANNYVNAQVVPGVSGRGVTGEFDLYAICTCTDTNTGQTQTQSFNFIVNFT
jgi:hypothetical protein